MPMQETINSHKNVLLRRIGAYILDYLLVIVIVLLVSGCVEQWGKASEAVARMKDNTVLLIYGVILFAFSCKAAIEKAKQDVANDGNAGRMFVPCLLCLVLGIFLNLLWVAFLVGQGSEGTGASEEQLSLRLIMFLVLPWLYWAITESSPLRGTPGKVLFGITTTDLEENRISFYRATGRYLARFITFWSIVMIIPGLIIASFMRKQPEGTLVHDLITGTIVTPRRRESSDSK
jgi:uncharacterized RDD family membrane protein YckC